MIEYNTYHIDIGVDTMWFKMFYVYHIYINEDCSEINFQQILNKNKKDYKFQLNIKLDA